MSMLPGTETAGTTVTAYLTTGTPAAVILAAAAVAIAVTTLLAVLVLTVLSRRHPARGLA